MALLIVFAFLAGAGTAITPCVLPVLPALLSASATGGRRRPLGIIIGLTFTHTLAIVAIATVIEGVGLAEGVTRTLAVTVLLLFGLALLWPALGDRLEAPLSRAQRLGPKSAGTGFWSGLAVGAALGFVYAPCAGPILASVVSVSATQGTSAELVAIAIAYGVGSAVVLFGFAYGGRRLLERIRSAGRGPALQRVLGVVMVATAVAMFGQLDVRFQTALANDFPDFLVNPTEALERSGASESRLADLRGQPCFDSSRGHGAAARTRAGTASELPVLGPAPEFVGTQKAFNTPGGSTPSLAALRGRVVLVDFWTYTCINCIRTFPTLRALDRRYRGDGLSVVGVHTPEFSFERRASNVKAAIEQNDLRYPVVQDNDFATWNAYGNQYWPAKYLIDARGNVRYTHFGEGGEAETEAAIRSLLAEAGRDAGGPRADARQREVASQRVQTRETYLGYERAEGFVRPLVPGSHSYRAPASPLPDSAFALSGRWSVARQSARAGRGAAIDSRFVARNVFLVLSSRGDRPRPVRVLLDGRPVRAKEAGRDVRGGVATVRRQRLYRLVSLPRVQSRRLTLRFAPGVSGYAFTFG